TDQRMPQMTGIEFLKETIPTHPETVRMILTGFSDVKDIIAAINDGKVYAYITKPWHKDELKISIDNALDKLLEKKRTEEEIDALKKEIERLNKVIEEFKQNV
ncbi:MAG: response regulator, partial [Cyclobacteriaceae bacterium]|nr:response regulator [Cyclobacteriaceae bacterium]